MEDENTKFIGCSRKLNKPGRFILTVRSKNSKVLHYIHRQLTKNRQLFSQK